MADRLASVFRRLCAQRHGLTSETEFCVEPVECRRPAYLGCSRAGRPVAFVDLGGLGADRTGTRLVNVEIQHAVRSSLRLAGGEDASGSYSVIACHAADPALQEVFLDAIEDVLARIDGVDGPDSLDRELAHLISLFRTLAMPGDRAWLGIWGELFLIHSASDRRMVLST